MTTDLYDYHYKQLETPYRSTIAFVDWLEKRGAFNGNILDVGSGGAAI